MALKTVQPIFIENQKKILSRQIMPKRVEMVWDAKKTCSYGTLISMDLADFSQVPKVGDIARSSKFDHLWRGRFLSYTLDFWPLSRLTGHLWILEIRQEYVCCVLRYGWPNMAPRRDSPVLNFSESLTVVGDVSFQPAGLQFWQLCRTPYSLRGCQKLWR